jgi:hypothetical protein
VGSKADLGVGDKQKVHSHKIGSRPQPNLYLLFWATLAPSSEVKPKINSQTTFQSTNLLINESLNPLGSQLACYLAR